MRKKAAKKRPSPARLMSTKELCLSLAGIAAFHVEDNAAQMKIYEAVRRLELLEHAAIAARLISSDT